MPARTKRGLSKVGNDYRAKKAKQPHGPTSSSVDVVGRADEQMMAMFDLGEDGVVEAVTTDEANVIGKQVDLRWDCWKEYEGTDKAGKLASCSIDGYVASYGWPEGCSPAYVVKADEYHYAFRPAVLLQALPAGFHHQHQAATFTLCALASAHMCVMGVCVRVVCNSPSLSLALCAVCRVNVGKSTTLSLYSAGYLCEYTYIHTPVATSENLASEA